MYDCGIGFEADEIPSELLDTKLCSEESSESGENNRERPMMWERVKEQGKEKFYECKICGVRFVTKQQLGGHTSKKHPGQSEKYRRRMENKELKNKSRELMIPAELMKKIRKDNRLRMGVDLRRKDEFTLMEMSNDF